MMNQAVGEKNIEVIVKIANSLRISAHELNKRGLNLAAKWTCEQLIGIRAEGSNCRCSTEKSNSGDNLESDMTLFAQTLLNQGEYQRCAQLMRKHSNNIKTNLGLFISSYSLYMAGEKLKSQQKLEGNKTKSSSLQNEKAVDSSTSYIKASTAVPKNPFLKDLFEELYPYFSTFHHDISEPNSAKSTALYSDNYDNKVSTQSKVHMDGYHMFLFAIVVRDLIRQGGGSTEVIKLALNNMLSSSQNGNQEASDDYHKIQAYLQFQSKYDTDTNTSNNTSNKHIFPSVLTLLLYALHLNPWNWSCWLELVKLCISENITPPSWQNILNIIPAWSNRHNPCIIKQEEGCKVMYDSFLTNFYLEKQNGENVLQVLNELMYIFPESQIVASELALAHYCLRDYDKAQEVFENMKEVDPYRIDHIDTFSNILYVKERSAELSHLAHSVIKIDKYAPETCCVIGNYYSLKGQHENAITYFRRALRLNSSFLSAWTLMGHEFVELRNTAAAIEAYSNAVAISSSDYRAWYGLGQTYEMLHLYQYALYYYKKAAALKSMDARMWCAVGNCCSRLGMKNDAILALQRAVRSGDKEGIATRELARLYREAGQNDLAAECYRRHLNVTSTEGDGMNVLVVVEGEGSGEGGELRTFQNDNNNQDNNYTDNYLSPSNDDIDGERAEALIFLATFHRDQGELHIAEAYGTRLMDYPGPEGDQARSLLREIRNLLSSSTNQQNKKHQLYQQFGSPNVPMRSLVPMPILPVSSTASSGGGVGANKTDINIQASTHMYNSRIQQESQDQSLSMDTSEVFDETSDAYRVDTSSTTDTVTTPSQQTQSSGGVTTRARSNINTH